ncbi:MAG TPA: TRAP transporter small permease [Candidatus Avamphibacillus sp.]|nr:TRAP transporter small permease [Candidatus Avamphibacillus sp.]
MKKAFYYLDDFVGSLCVSFIIILVGLNVLMRYVFISPIAWTEEISIALFVWMTFIGVSSAMKRGGHIGVDYFVRKMPFSLKVVSEVIRGFAIMLVLVYIFIVLGFDLIDASSRKKTTILGMQYKFIYFAIPIGGVLTAIHFLRDFVKRFKYLLDTRGDD